MATKQAERAGVELRVHYAQLPLQSQNWRELKPPTLAILASADFQAAVTCNLL